MGNELDEPKPPPWAYNKPRRDGTSHAPKLRSPEEIAVRSLSLARDQSERAAGVAADQQRTLLKKAVRLLKANNAFTMTEVIIDGRPYLQDFFMPENTSGIAIDGEGNIVFFHRPIEAPEQIIVNTDVVVSDLATIAYAPVIIKGIHDHFEREMDRRNSLISDNSGKRIEANQQPGTPVAK